MSSVDLEDESTGTVVKNVPMDQILVVPRRLRDRASPELIDREVTSAELAGFGSVGPGEETAFHDAERTLKFEADDGGVRSLS